MTEPSSRRQDGGNAVRFERLAEQIANDLRSRILTGDLSDGSSAFPVEEELRGHYRVSKPTLREAMRILEAEGLITVRRGALGGAQVHRPSSGHVAYTLGLVLAHRKADIKDVGNALRAVEPACAAMCALRSDRNETVVPALRLIHNRGIRAADNLVEITTLSRIFHETIVALCGNESLAVLGGALESLWTSCEASWVRTAEVETIPRDERLRMWDDHAAILSAITEGDSARAQQVAVAHLNTSQGYPLPDDQPFTVSPNWVRSVFLERGDD